MKKNSMRIFQLNVNVPNVVMSGKKKLTVISLFAGCGGSSLGYKLSGFKELLAVDLDQNAIETFSLNFNVPIWQKDIRRIKGNEILTFCGIEKGNLDVLDGSPPCQGFSLAGKRQVLDKRNDLVFEFIRLVKELQPKVFVMENVSGMVKGIMKGLFIQYIKSMKLLDYNIKCKLMNAKYYNVPQSRERLIFIGVRKDIGVPSFPDPSDKMITVKRAIGHLKNQTVPTDKTEKFKEYWNEARYGKSVGKFKARKKLNPNKPAPTVQAQRPNYHWKEPRSLSVLESSLLQSFPEGFIWTGNYYEKIKRIGNSVPPKFMQAIAENIKNNVLRPVT